jgi:predicted AlkP superfamily phosphohydrolase/phosphomutase/tetratricopeptide (TPR) repeat protein
MTRLLLVGWDAADWKVIDRLLAKGEMPHLARLLAEGVRGNLATIHPPLSPMVWTTIATGNRPAKHGIHGFTEPTEDGLAVRPISNLGRKTKAIWNILNQNGKRSLVVGWWPSHPAEPIRGVMVSDQFPPGHGQPAEAPLKPGTVWPPAWAARLAELRVHGREMSGDMLRLFVPEAASIDQQQDRSLSDLAGIIAETMSIHAAATELLAHEPWDLAAVYFTGIDHFSHRFMRHHAGKARQPENGSDPALFAGVVPAAYRYHDAMLGRLMQLAGPDAAVMIVSDHGFHSDHLLPDEIPAEAAGPAVEHRDFGVFCLKGPGVRRGARIYGASVLDVAPTVLHLYGLPSGADMDGKVLINAFEKPQLLPAIPSWDALAGEDGCHPKERQHDGTASVEAMKQLVALGYVAPPGEDSGRAVAECVEENRYNLARALIDAGDCDRAADILRALVAADPTQIRYHRHLFQCLLRRRRFGECGKLLDALDRTAETGSREAAAELKRRRAARPDTAVTATDRREMFERRRLAARLDGFAGDRLLMRCRLALGRGVAPAQRAEARALLDQLASHRRLRRGLALFLAEGFLLVREHDRALDLVQQARRRDREDWRAIALEARIHQAARRDDAAIACAVQSLSLVYFQPFLHHLMGLSLRRQGARARAEQAFRIALSQAPGLVAAHDELFRLLSDDPARIGEATFYRAQAELLRGRAREPQPAAAAAPAEPAFTAAPVVSVRPQAAIDRSRVVTVVTGLPRSGTSMMMQMLAAGGILPYTDGRRQADDDNPRGYFEHEQATRLHEDPSWIPQARGKAVKLVLQLLPFLPRGESYRVILLRRNLDEVVASQRAMLERLGRAGAGLSGAELAGVYAGQLARARRWFERHPRVAAIELDYAAVLADPNAAAARLAGFLGEPFAPQPAAAAVAPDLCRQRADGAQQVA